MNIEKKRSPISPKVIERLTQYLRHLENLSPEDFISSKELEIRTGFTATQIRKDLSYFGEFGTKGKGYSIRNLYNNIEKILGIQKTNNIIIIGIGRLGGALVEESEFTKESFNIIGVFDNSKSKIGTEIKGIKIRDIKEIPFFFQSKDRIDIAILTVPKKSAQQITTLLIKAGVKSILNFAPINLDIPNNIAVQNIDLYAKLQELNYWKEYRI